MRIKLSGTSAFNIVGLLTISDSRFQLFIESYEGFNRFGIKLVEFVNAILK